MKAIEFLAHLSAKDVKLTVSGDKLWFDAPAGAMTPEVRERIASHKAEIITLLQTRGRDAQPGGDRIILGDCLDAMKPMADNCVDLMVTDPPYGLEFMGMDWDKAVPAVEIWQECRRVLKPGAFAFIMSAPRQDLLARMVGNLQQAGFGTGFSPIYWTYASGFPKAHCTGKSIERRDSALKRFEGSYLGFQPKPAVEVILVVMKPLDQKGYVDQVLANGKGVTWLDECRIPYGDETASIGNRHRHNRGDGYGFKPQWQQQEGAIGIPERKWEQDVESQAHEQGRFPANLLVSDDVLDDGIVHARGTFPARRGRTVYFGLGQLASNIKGRITDTGNYSRFFSLDAWAERNLPFLFVPKPSKHEKNLGLDGMEPRIMKGTESGQNGRNVAFKPQPSLRKNHHPTVKPVRLMAYLITMGSRQGDLILDPFCGSGTTCLAACQLGRRSIGIEINPDYHEIASKKMDHLIKTMRGKEKAA